MNIEEKITCLERLMSTSEHTILPVEKFKEFLKSNTHVVIYGDVGVTLNSLNGCLFGLIQALGSDVQFSVLSAEDIKTGHWCETATLFVVPGGATTPIRRMLDSEGLGLIQKYVQEGGRYLGFCAGAYLGASRIEFAKGDKDLERITEDNLAFYAGTKYGPMGGVYDYHSNAGLSFYGLTVLENSELNQVAYTNGGGWFEVDPTDTSTTPLALYTDQPDKTAILEVVYGKGKACLSAAHLEYDSQLFQDEIRNTKGYELYDNDNRLILLRTLLHRLLKE